jgi:hypothetical protein
VIEALFDKIEATIQIGMRLPNSEPRSRSGHHPTMRYAVWRSCYDGKPEAESPQLLETAGRLFVGGRLPSGWVTEVVQEKWTDDQGHVYDGRVRVAVKRPGSHRS